MEKRTPQTDVSTLPVENSKAMLRYAITDSSFQIIIRGPVEEIDAAELVADRMADF